MVKGADFPIVEWAGDDWHARLRCPQCALATRRLPTRRTLKLACGDPNAKHRLAHRLDRFLRVRCAPLDPLTQDLT